MRSCPPRLTPTTTDDRAALREPIFWVALALLLINDHLLKGAGALPGWLTGKLSDFAGLVVAPVLLVVLLRARSPLARAACIAAIVAPFVAIKVSPSAARSLESAVALFGIPWRIWTDPTDLVALLVLPFVFRITAPRASVVRPVLDHAAMVLSGIACIATSTVNGGWTTTAYVLNRTASTTEVRVRWLRGELSCDSIEAVVERALTRESFGEGATYSLETGQTLPLDTLGAGLDGMTVPAVLASDAPCGAALVQIDGLEDTVVLWRRVAAVWVPATQAGGVDPPLGAVIVRGEPGSLSLRTRGSHLRLSPIDDDLEPDSACRSTNIGERFAWSDPGSSPMQGYLLSVAPQPDGCLALELERDDLTTRTLFLCIPEDAFPFEAGQSLRVEQTALADGSRRLSVSNDATPPIAMTAFSGSSAPAAAGLDGEIVTAACAGGLTACGAFVQDASVVLRGMDGGPMTIASGRVGDGEISGAPVRVWVGAAEHVVVSDPSCDQAQSSVGARADVLIVSGEVQ